MEQKKRLRSLIYDMCCVFAGYAALTGALLYFLKVPFHPALPLVIFKTYSIWNMPDPMKYAYTACFFWNVLSLFLSPFRKPQDSYGNARWAKNKDIKAMDLRAKQGIVLGKFGGKYLVTDDPLSVLIFAPPGTGKTAAIIIPTLLNCQNSVLVYDPKGELWDKTAPYRSHYGDVIRFAPGEDGGATWNPMAKEELPNNFDDVAVLVDRIASTLWPVDTKGDDYWPRAAQGLFTFWALFLIHRDGETTFPTILEHAMTEDPQGAIQEVLFEDGIPKRIILQGNAMVAKGDKEFGSIFGTFETGLKVFLDERVARTVSGSKIRMADLRKQRTSIYLVVSNADQKRLKDFLALFFELATLSLIHKEPKAEELGVTIALDECRRLGKMAEIITLPAISRSYRVNTIYVFQSLSQVIDIYGKGGLGELKNACAYHAFFTQQEDEIASSISKTIGQYTRRRKSISGRLMQSKSTSVSEEGVPLMRPEDITSMPMGRLIVQRQGFLKIPIKADAAWWFKDPTFKKLVTRCPMANESPAPTSEDISTNVGDTTSTVVPAVAEQSQYEPEDVEISVEEIEIPDIDTPEKLEKDQEEDPKCFDDPLGDYS